MKHWFMTVSALAVAGASTLLPAQQDPAALSRAADVHARIAELGKLLQASKLDAAEQARARAVVAELEQMLVQHDRRHDGHDGHDAQPAADAPPEAPPRKPAGKDAPAVDPHRSFFETMHGLMGHGAGKADPLKGDAGAQRAAVEKALQDPAVREKLQRLMHDHPAEALDHFESVFKRVTHAEAAGTDPFRKPDVPPEEASHLGMLHRLVHDQQALAHLQDLFGDAREMPRAARAADPAADPARRASSEPPAEAELRAVTDDLREQISEVRRLLQEIRELAGKHHGADTTAERASRR